MTLFFNLLRCLIKNPDHRPVMMELGEHPFIQEIPEDSSMVKKQFLHTFFFYFQIIH